MNTNKSWIMKNQKSALPASNTLLLRLFGNDYLFVKRAFEAELKYISESCQVKEWQYIILNDGGFFIRPKGEYFLKLDVDGFSELVSSHAAGVVCCLNVYKSLIFLDRFRLHYLLLSEYSKGLNESNVIDLLTGVRDRFFQVNSSLKI